LEVSGYFQIPLLVLGDLLFPPFGPGLGGTVMFGAPMPKAAIHEDGNLRPRKYDIGTTEGLVTQAVA
jgi:hypothetical protein